MTLNRVDIFSMLLQSVLDWCVCVYGGRAEVCEDLEGKLIPNPAPLCCISSILSFSAPKPAELQSALSNRSQSFFIVWHPQICDA